MKNNGDKIAIALQVCNFWGLLEYIYCTYSMQIFSLRVAYINYSYKHTYMQTATNM